MNRSRRGVQNKQFVSGGVYDSQQNYGYQKNQSPRMGQQNQSQQAYSNQQQQMNQHTPVRQQQQYQQQKEQQENEQQQTPQQQRQQPQQVKVTAPLQPPPEPPKIDPEPEIVHPNKTSFGECSFVDESGKLQFKKIFIARKKSSVRAKEKKIRQNRQLRKAIIPKNALMALNEVWGVTISDFNVNSNVNSGGFTAFVTVNDKQYEGRGSSKMAAKNNACEKALRDYILEKMRQKPRLPRNPAANHNNNMDADSETEAMDTNESNMDSTNNDEAQKSGTDDISDDMPMINLASFAIYKLFAEWESEGFEVPELHMSSAQNINANGSENGKDGPSVPKVPKQPPIRSELPPNWEAMHPATLLCMMRPGLTYVDYGTIGEKPNVLQRVGVTVDDKEYIGEGRSKKAARRNTAISVCNELFGTNFEQEDQPMTE